MCMRGCTHYNRSLGTVRSLQVRRGDERLFLAISGYYCRWDSAHFLGAIRPSLQLTSHALTLMLKTSHSSYSRNFITNMNSFIRVGVNMP
jgi:hypothetical protein